MKKIKGSIQELFDSRHEPVTETGCWIWTGSMTDSGYGLFFHKGKRSKATHVSWELHHGKKFPKGMLACHHCDTRSCVNPHHIFIGTYNDNNLDAAKKGRTAKGDKHPHAKITEKLAREIKYRLANKNYRTVVGLAMEYGVSNQIIHNIKSGKLWSYV